MLNSQGMVMGSGDNKMAKSNKSQHAWIEEETAVYLQIMEELNIMKYIDGRKQKYRGLGWF